LRNNGEKNKFFSLPLLQIEKENIGFLAMVEEFFFFLTLRKSKVEPKGAHGKIGEDY
jgi:hypothetical protein